MTQINLYPLPGNEATAARITQTLRARGHDARVAACEVHRFPDGEALLRLDPPAPEAESVLVCTLDHPDAKTVPLLMAAATLRELGTRRIGLVAPYLAYMRQDARFAPGQAISARVYAALLSAHCDWLLTVDPHLHRIHDLGEIYTLRTHVLHAAPLLAEWIARNVSRPLILGPDRESMQWAEDVARRVGAPLVVLDKIRLGDTAVRISVPDLSRWPGHTPVLIDDVISSGRTLIVALEHLRTQHTPPPVCVAVHGLCAGDALPAILAAGAARVMCSNSVAHAATPIDLTGLLADGIVTMLATP
jgi:ribose-phosphate pyrophosphokinase